MCQFWTFPSPGLRSLRAPAALNGAISRTDFEHVKCSLLEDSLIYKLGYIAAAIL